MALRSAQDTRPGGRLTRLEGTGRRVYACGLKFIENGLAGATSEGCEFHSIPNTDV